MIVALELDRSIDLALFTRYLAQIGVPHRVTEDGDKQVVWVPSEAEKERVLTLYDKITRGEITLEQRAGGAPLRLGGRSGIFGQLLGVPLTALLIVANVLCFPVTFGLDQGDVSGWMQAMTFTSFELRGQYVYFGDLASTMASGEYWRFLTPMFLHFGVLHIVFNLLWVWEIGRRIEIVNGAPVLLLVTLVTSLSSNFMQYFMGGASLFGGMSGVVFGLLGFALVWSKMVPKRNLGLSNSIYIFMLVFLALGFSGIFDFLLPGSLANGAHLGGLLAGLGIGAVAAGVERVS